ncbi:hypothetical protein RJ640_007509 [Escallonia rubra]|uniref:DUF4283 domain-containing protein n=1 Tax=Escallonia rubra TaxID=112253 RepID=A0AA88U6D9_9ASTE|nr:hypothetical protein RJ640_007509 [Escallonia rubra]
MEIGEEALSDDEDLEIQSPISIMIVHLTTEFKEEIRKTWQKALIIKNSHGWYLATNGNVQNGYRITKFNPGTNLTSFINLLNSKIDYRKAVGHGPSFVGINYLSVKKWVLNFDPNIRNISQLAIWIRLLSMPSVDRNILTQVGRELGIPLRAKTITAAVSRGRFARLCAQIDTAKPLIKHIQICKHIQQENEELKSTMQDFQAIYLRTIMEAVVHTWLETEKCGSRIGVACNHVNNTSQEVDHALYGFVEKELHVEGMST